LVAPIGKTVLGGLSFGTLMTLFLMPTVYAIMNKRSDERRARAEARRERIAAGISRKQAKQRVKAAEAGGTYAFSGQAGNEGVRDYIFNKPGDLDIGEAGL
jgi:HAE1 family hydrophobic/amphiphilic exporter-1